MSLCRNVLCSLINEIGSLRLFMISCKATVLT